MVIQLVNNLPAMLETPVQFLGRSPGERNGYPLHYSGLENSMDYIIHEVINSRALLSDFNFRRLTLWLSTKESDLHFAEVSGPTMFWQSISYLKFIELSWKISGKDCWAHVMLMFSTCCSYVIAIFFWEENIFLCLPHFPQNFQYSPISHLFLKDYPRDIFSLLSNSLLTVKCTKLEFTVYLHKCIFPCYYYLN